MTTELEAAAFRTVGRGDAVATLSFPTTSTTSSDGSQSRESRTASTRSMISVPAPTGHARCLEDC